MIFVESKSGSPKFLKKPNRTQIKQHNFQFLYYYVPSHVHDKIHVTGPET